MILLKFFKKFWCTLCILWNMDKYRTRYLASCLPHIAVRILSFVLDFAYMVLNLLAPVYNRVFVGYCTSI